MAETAEEKAAREASEAEAAAETERRAAAEAAAKTLNQTEVDAIVEARLARERKKFADYDELKAKASKFDEVEAASLSELEKERKKAADAEARATAVSAERDAERINSAIVAAAVTAGVKNVKLLGRAIDKTGLTIGDDGQVSGIEDAIKVALVENPELVGKSSQGSGDQGARGGSGSQITQEQLSKMTPEEITKALSAGELSHLL